MVASHRRPSPADAVIQLADATHDHQWIHTDPERARGGPFGAPIAHGYLTLSLLIPLWSQILVIDNLDMAVNYGLNKPVCVAQMVHRYYP